MKSPRPPHHPSPALRSARQVAHGGPHRSTSATEIPGWLKTIVAAAAAATPALSMVCSAAPTRSQIGVAEAARRAGCHAKVRYPRLLRWRTRQQPVCFRQCTGPKPLGVWWVVDLSRVVTTVRSLPGQVCLTLSLPKVVWWHLTAVLQRSEYIGSSDSAGAHRPRSDTCPAALAWPQQDAFCCVLLHALAAGRLPAEQLQGARLQSGAPLWRQDLPAFAVHLMALGS